MYKVREYIHKIVHNGSQEDMKALNEVLLDALDNVKDHDEKGYRYFEAELYEIANGKELCEDMAKEWVNSMKPIGEHWTILETTDAMNNLGYTFNRVDFYVVTNMIYNDYYDIVKDNDNLTMKIAKDWLDDEDAKEHKIYEYWKHVVNRDV